MYPYGRIDPRAPWISAQTQMIPESIKQMMAEHIRLMKEIDRKVGRMEEQMRRSES